MCLVILLDLKDRREAFLESWKKFVVVPTSQLLTGSGRGMAEEGWRKRGSLFAFFRKSLTPASGRIFIFAPRVSPNPKDGLLGSFTLGGDKKLMTSVEKSVR
jgi:hypothetical protein